MFESIILAILLIIIISVLIWFTKLTRSGKEFLLFLVIGFGILGGVVWCFKKMGEFSPLEAGFWLYLVIGVLFILVAIKFLSTVDDYELKKRRKEQEKEKKRLEEELGAMFCRNCGKELIGGHEICPQCGARPMRGNSFCSNCGAPTTPLTKICPKCGEGV